MEKICLTEHIHQDGGDLLRTKFEVVQATSAAEADVIAQAQGCAGILVRSAKITDAVMAGVPTLRVVAKHGIGVDNIDVAAATRRGILVVNAPLSNVNAVAEHTVALILAAARQLVLLDRLTRDGGFRKRDQYVTCELEGKTVGLLGLGRISSLVAKKLSAFGVRLLASDPYLTPQRAEELGVELVDMDTLLKESRFLSLHTPLTPDTKGMMGKAAFEKMRPDAWLVNASRGPVVDEAALCEALRTGQIAGAALDVFEEEPPADDDPLFAMDNVILSPHNAALSDNALRAMAVDSAQGILDYLTGEKPRFPVNPDVLNRAD